MVTCGFSDCITLHALAVEAVTSLAHKRLGTAGLDIAGAAHAAAGRAPILELKTIKFDIFRFQQAAREGIPLGTEGKVAEQFVRRHVKTLRTGLFWWSPPVRYQIGGRAAGRAERLRRRLIGPPIDQ